MKQFLKYSLLLLTSIAFMASALELNMEEYKHSFKKGDQTYNVSLLAGVAYDFKIDHPTDLPGNFISLLVQETFFQQTVSFNFFADPDPPERLYIRYSIFRV